MAYWLLKSEPGTWSWEDQVKAGAKGAVWEGIRNHLAKKHLMTMKSGERAFFYHSVDEKRIMGIVEIIGEYEPDPTDSTGRFGMIRIKALTPMLSPVTLQQCKANKKLANMVLLHNSRLSVQPVTDQEWTIACRLGGLKKV
jgi:predicted RNA-binding protein with PUA-like domain